MKNDAIEHTEYKGYDIDIRQDDNALSPNEDGDDELFLVHYHRDFQVEKTKIVSKDDVRQIYQTGKHPLLKQYYVFRVAALIHGGVTLRLESGGFAEDPGGWDTSHVGLIFAEKTGFTSRVKAENAARSLINMWNAWLNGESYGYDISGGDGKINDSLWGYNNINEAIADAKSAIDYHLEEAKKQYSKMVKDITRGVKKKPIPVKSHLRNGWPVRQHRRNKSGKREKCEQCGKFLDVCGGHIGEQGYGI
jgi:hypothetical protein